MIRLGHKPEAWGFMHAFHRLVCAVSVYVVVTVLLRVLQLYACNTHIVRIFEGIPWYTDGYMHVCTLYAQVVCSWVIMMDVIARVCD